MKMGVVGAILLILVVCSFLSIFAASTFFTKKMIFDKRIFEERILSTGNEVETYTRVIDSASDLATIQAIYDVGQNKIIYDDYKYNPDNYLPYWNSIPEDEIKDKISSMSLIYLKKYENSYDDFFEERNKNPINEKSGISWELIWPDDSKQKTEFNENNIENYFGIATIEYKSSYLEITKEFPIDSSIKIKFNEILDIASNVAQDILDGSTIEDIQNFYSQDDIKVDLSTKDDYIIVHVYEDKLYPVYSISDNKVVSCNLGLKFLIDIDGTDENGVYANELNNLKECKSEKYGSIWVLSTNEKICELYLA